MGTPAFIGIHTRAPEIVQVLKTAFPEYNGHKFQLKTLTNGLSVGSYWSGGSRSYFKLVNLATLKTMNVPESRKPIIANNVPDGVALAQHDIFCGKDMGLILHVLPSNLSRLLVNKVELMWTEKVVLTATRSLKSSYAGIKNFRYIEASRQTGITSDEWDEAEQRLKDRKLLNKAGAITLDGKNAIGSRIVLEALKRGAEIV